MKSLVLLSLAIAIFSTSEAQVYRYTSSIGNFSDASSFYINAAGFIYVTDRETNEVFKLDTLGTKLKENGGFGWDEAAFDSPEGIFATTLNVYVCDRNNHRVQFFDKDLNFLLQLRTRTSEIEELQFGYPVSAAVNKQGDLFILDTENKRVLKFDLFGNFIQNFGGYNYGKHSLIEPIKLAVGFGNNVYVVDKNRLVVFDQYGNAAGIDDFVSGITDVNFMHNYMTVISNNQVLYVIASDGPKTDSGEIDLGGYTADNTLLSSIFFNNKLYILTSKKIDVFTAQIE